jgi:hypothetical protein
MRSRIEENVERAEHVLMICRHFESHEFLGAA